MDTISPPQFEAEIGLINLSAIQSESLVLECSAVGRPLPTITWFRNGNEIQAVPGSIQISADMRKLTLINISSSIEGRYICQAENKAGIRRKTFEISVLIPPITSSETRVETRADSEARLTCFVTGIPKPDVLWIKLGKPVSGPNFRMEENNLFIEKVLSQQFFEDQLFSPNTKAFRNKMRLLQILF